MRHHRYLAANGVDSSGEFSSNTECGYYTALLEGMPLDAKAVTRL